MTQDDMPGVRGAPGGPGGRQGAPGGSSLPQAPRRVIKQTNNDSKPWFIVPKVCCDLKGMVFTHLGPLGCITTAILSEHANQSKTGSGDKFYVAVFPAHPVQFREGFAIFHTPQDTQGVWKIAKKPNLIVKFGWKNGRRFAYFFQKIGCNFSKNCQNYKKII